MNNISVNLAREIVKSFPRLPYNDWLKVISSVANSFNLNESLYILDSMQNEKPNEIQNKIEKRLKSISIATLLYYAKLYNFDFKEYYSRNKSELTDKFKNTSTYKFNQIQQTARKTYLGINIPKRDKLIYRFSDTAIQTTINEFISSGYDIIDLMTYANDLNLQSKTRLLRLAINENFKNKEIPDGNKNHYSKNFKNVLYDIPELINIIKSGFAFITCNLKNDSDSRVKNNWFGSDCFCIDIDGNLPLENGLNMELTQTASLIYTSFNHTEQKNRYRILFKLPFLIENENDYINILNKFIAYYNADKQCNDVVRLWFGNENAKIIDIENGLIYD